MVANSIAHVQALIELRQIQADDERRTAWRQGMAALAAFADEHDVPLEGLDPQGLRQSVRIALELGLVDNLDWLSETGAALALYELGAALPAGAERNELARLLTKRLLSIHADGFAAVATRLAANSPRSIRSLALRARVALAMELPGTSTPRADALALALVSHRQLERDWVSIPSTGALSSRVLAARLLERAAREAARRARQGDESAAEVFERPSLKTAWARLLADRESLVWRHVACARGLLIEAKPRWMENIDADLDAQGTISSWRRGATSLTAALAVSLDTALHRCRRLLESEISKRDPDISSSMIYGLKHVLDTEPHTAEALVEMLIRQGGLQTIEAFVELRRERFDTNFGAKAVERARGYLRAASVTGGTEDDGRAALVRALDAELDPSMDPSNTLAGQLMLSLKLFAERGAEPALEKARNILTSACDIMALLETTQTESSKGRRLSALALWQLDIGLLESARLRHLLDLGDVVSDSTTQLGQLYGRLSNWFSKNESEPIAREGTVPHLTLRLRRMRTWLHFVDADGAYGQALLSDIRARQLDNAARLLGRVRNDAHSPLRRTVCASASRACDALVRNDICAVSDAFLIVANYVPDQRDLRAFAEASMIQELEALYLEVAAIAEPPAPNTVKNKVQVVCLALRRMANHLPHGGSSRVEALRQSLRLAANALSAIDRAKGLDTLGTSEGSSSFVLLGQAAQQLAQLGLGAALRLNLRVASKTPRCGELIETIDLAIAQLKAGSEDLRAQIIVPLRKTLNEELPKVFADCIADVLERVADYPLYTPSRIRKDTSIEFKAIQERPLPDWLPPGRSLGAYYVLYTLGVGAGGSVFAAKRREEKDYDQATLFALKVPEYNGAAARTLAEAEFLQMFREEAAALLTLPFHPNLARLVTFDAASKPKPILVTEFIEGPSLARIIQTQQLSTVSALSHLFGVGAALQTMHDYAIGHLDVKPSNIILRHSQDQAQLTPVLVDFGLAGRKVRPGCATSPYGAPEIWGSDSHMTEHSPAAADVYAFSCLIFEAFTGQMLFEGSTEYAVINAHMNHDGDPLKLRQLHKNTAIRPFIELLQSGLRKEPAQRATIADLLRGLRDLAPMLTSMRWPIGYPRRSITPMGIRREAMLGS